MTQMQIVAAIAQAAAEQEKQLQQISAAQTKQAEELQGIRDVVSLNSTGWRKLPVKPINYKEVKPMLQQRKVYNVTQSPQVTRLIESDDIFGILKASDFKEYFKFIGQLLIGVFVILGVLFAFGACKNRYCK